VCQAGSPQSSEIQVRSTLSTLCDGSLGLQCIAPRCRRSLQKGTRKVVEVDG
jgi:hypothetical protein